jgi:uncharacterized protein YndB with AHSA1/START domain
MLKKLALGAVALLLVLVAVIATRPPTFRIERSAVIAAPPEVVFAQLQDLRRWRQWNPYDKMDPAARMSFASQTAGPGASYHYVSDKVGEGRMTLTDVQPYRHVGVRADFIRPMAATHQIDFTLTPEAGGTRLSWAMRGRNGFLNKAASMVMDMDGMVGGEFEKGLADLKRLAETAASASTASAKPAAAPAPAAKASAPTA